MKKSARPCTFTPRKKHSLKVAPTPGFHPPFVFFQCQFCYYNFHLARGSVWALLTNNISWSEITKIDYGIYPSAVVHPSVEETLAPVISLTEWRGDSKVVSR